MLRVNKITITNFGPYFGSNCITFPSENGVCVVWGDNGVGKTSIMNSFRYGLWGTIINRKKQAISPAGFVNLKAQEQRQDMKVEVDMTYNGESYLLTRGLHRVRGNGDKLEDYEQICKLLKGSSVVSPNERDHFLSTALPESISRFYLFDAELLSEYEDLLDDQDIAGEKIKEAIEAILGLPILVNASTSVSAIATEAAAESDKIAKADSKTKDISNVLEGLRVRVINHEKAKKELQELLAKYISEESDLKDRLSSTVKYREKLGALDSLNEEIRQYDENILSLKRDLYPIMDDSWHNIINTVLANEIEQINNTIKTIEAKDREYQISQTIKDYLLKCITDNSDVCPACGSHVSEHIKQNILERINAMASISSLSKEEQDSLKYLHGLVALLQSQETPSSKALAELSLKTISDTQNIRNLRSAKLEEVKQDLSKMQSEESEESARRLGDLMKKCGENIKETKRGIQSEDNIIKDLLADIAKNEKARAKLSTNKTVAEAVLRSEICSKINSLLAEGIDLFRDKLKRNVQNDASSLFVKVAHNPRYKTLEINDNYGLEIKTESERIVPNRSSGYEQVVAISLISSLHKNAPISGPIFMDSTFQRIDPKHKNNIMKILPELGDQVLVLAYEGEITHGDTRDILGHHLLKEFNLEQIDEFETHIK